MYKDLTAEQRLERIAQIINKGIYLLALKEGWFVNLAKREKEKQIKALSFEEQQIIELCTNNGRVTNRDVQDLFGVHRNTATLKLKDMVLRGLLTQKGNRRHTYYVLSQFR
jgi:predicted HTH transcriptional regulator